MLDHNVGIRDQLVHFAGGACRHAQCCAQGLTRAVRVQTLGAELQIAELIGYQDAVTCIAMSADARIAISGSTDGLACVWDVPANKYLRTLHGHTKSLSRVAITPDGKRAVTAGMDGHLCVWNVNTGEMLSKVDFNAILYSAAISDDGKIAAGGAHDGDVKFVAVDKDEVFGVLKHSQRIWALALNADGSRAAVGRCTYSDTPPSSPQGSVSIYDTATRTSEAEINWIHNCSMLKFIDHGRQLQWFSAPENYGTLDAATFQPVVKRYFLDANLDFGVDLPADSSFVLLAYSPGSIDLARPTDTQQQYRHLPGNAGANRCVAVSPDGRIVLVGGWGRTTGTEDGFPARHAGAVAVLDLNHKSQSLVRFGSKAEGDTSLTMSRDGKMYAVSGGRGIRLYDVKQSKYLPTDLLGSLCLFTSDDQQLISFTGGQLKISTIGASRVTTLWGTYDYRICAALSSDDHWLIAGNRLSDDASRKIAPGTIAKDLQVYDLKKNQRAADLATGLTPLSAISISPDGKWVAATLSGNPYQPELEQSIQVWDIKQARELLHIKVNGVYSAPQLSTQGILAAARGRAIYRWEVKTGHPLPPLHMDLDVHDLCFNSDGSRLLISLLGGDIEYVNQDTGQPVAAYKIAEADRVDVKFLTGGSAVAIAFRLDGTASVFPLALPK